MRGFVVVKEDFGVSAPVGLFATRDEAERFAKGADGWSAKVIEFDADGLAVIPAEVVASSDESGDYFGTCPECGKGGHYLNVGRNHWFVCDAHKVKWYAGSNLFSSWKEESEETWKANDELLKGYTLADDYRPPCGREAAGTRAA
jgi:hypothetical protein